jgi:hypothetical protein
MPLDQAELTARIDSRVAELRLLAAKTAVQSDRPGGGPTPSAFQRAIRQAYLFGIAVERARRQADGA